MIRSQLYLYLWIFKCQCIKMSLPASELQHCSTPLSLAWQGEWCSGLSGWLGATLPLVNQSALGLPVTAAVFIKGENSLDN